MAGKNPRILKIFEHCIEVMKQLGALIIDPADVRNFDKFDETEGEVLHYEFKADLNKYLRSLEGTGRLHSLADVIRFNEENADRVMPYFGQEHMLTAQEKGPLSEKKYKDALAKNLRMSRTLGIDAVMTTHQLDALVVPAVGPAWATDLLNGDRISGGGTTPAAVAGYPSITVPGRFLDPTGSIENPHPFGTSLAMGPAMDASILRELFGAGVSSLRAERRTFAFRYRSFDHWLAFFRTYYGPVNKAAKLDPSEFNTIGVKLAKRAGVPVVPIALKTDAWGNGKHLKDFGKIDPSKKVRFVFGRPLLVSEQGGEEHRAIIAFICEKV